MAFLSIHTVRRLVSLSFAALITFNTVGYSYVLDWYRDDLNRKAEELIDNHISEISGNLIFTVPVTQLYQAAMTEYTRTEGEFLFEGVSYRMVKQKVQGNLLYVVCVNDQAAHIATDEINDLIAATSGQTSNESSSTAKNISNSLLKYCDTSTASNSQNSNGWLQAIGFTKHEDDYRYDGSHTLFHPPAVI
ncbi:MAG TPA: hypothetical protein VFE50_07645 [Cyclobacteriaceae bacterium]|nr:hypothetical protein [Cyclobacteriaceae bacterium]